MGASRLQTVVLLVKDFSALVVIANVLAWPAGFYISRRWLLSFAYRMEIAKWIFIVAGFSVLAIVLLTIDFQAVRAAGSDPVKKIRYE